MFKKLALLFISASILGACQANAPTPQNLTLPTPTVAPSPTPTQQSEEVTKLLNLKSNQKMIATIKTSKGSINLVLFPEKAPNTVANFVGLAEGTKDWVDPKTAKTVTGKSLYAGTIFHRVIKGFMIQGGDPLGSGMGGPGYKFADEQTGESYTRGTLAMANSGPNTNGSQFFIMHTDYQLPPNYTVFGRIDASDSASLKTVDAIATVKTDANDRPVDKVIIESIVIDRQ